MEEIISKYFKDLNKETTNIEGLHIFSNKNFRLIIKYLQNSIQVVTFAIVRDEKNIIYIPITEESKTYLDTDTNILDSLLGIIKSKTITKAERITPIIRTRELFSSSDISMIQVLLQERSLIQLLEVSEKESYNIIQLLAALSMKSENHIRLGDFENLKVFDILFDYVERLIKEELLVEKLIRSTSSTLSIILKESDSNITEILKAIKDGKGKQLNAFIQAS